MTKKFLIILLSVFVLSASGCTLPWQSPPQVGCDMDAKLCPDGSAVGRSGPNCEFSPCPGASLITDFESCAAAGNPIMESYPRQCSANGRTFTEILAGVGSSCTQSADCQLPLDYAVRSNCPYQAYCYNQTCAVGCPLWQETTNTWEVKCRDDNDCNCAAWNEQTNYACACVDNQCVSIISGINTGNGSEPIACTMEAKLCPDGSAVGRSGPNCEFSPCPEPASDLSGSCQENNGNWLSRYNECENISPEWCRQHGGVFNECDSACRHNPQAEMCIEVCVPVCKIL